ncbi:MAG: Gfo/Idh/MocA family protein [Planctomycetota bacterium]
MKLRVGVVGVGSAWRTRHCPALRALADRFEVRAVCAEVAARAERAAAEFGATAVDGFRALTRRDDIDAILVLTSEWYGPLPLLAACEYGKAVYCAAALDMDPRRTAEIKRRVEDSGVAFMAEFPRRHAPATVRLKELIATQLGPPRLLFCHGRDELIARSGGGPTSAGGQQWSRDLLELVDWVWYIVGCNPSWVVGMAHHGCDGSVDFETITLDFSSRESVGTGPLAQITLNRYLKSAWREAAAFHAAADLKVCCERGVAFLDLPGKLVWFDDAGQHVESLEDERPVGEQMLLQFHRAVTSLFRKTSDLEDTYRALRVVLAARESHASGRRIGLDDCV